MTAMQSYGYDKWLDATVAEQLSKGKSTDNLVNHLPPANEFSDCLSALKWESVYWDVPMSELVSVDIEDLIDPTLSTNPLTTRDHKAYTNEGCIELGVLHVIIECERLPTIPKLTAWLSVAGYNNPIAPTRALTLKQTEKAVMRLVASGFLNHILNYDASVSPSDEGGGP